MDQEEDEEDNNMDKLLYAGKDYDIDYLNTFERQQRSVMSTLSKVSASVINKEDPHI